MMLYRYSTSESKISSTPHYKVERPQFLWYQDCVLATMASLTWLIILVSSATNACAQLLKVTMLLSQWAMVPSSDVISCWLMAGLIRLQNLENWSLVSLPCLWSSISLKASTMGARALSCSSRFQRSRICKHIPLTWGRGCHGLSEGLPNTPVGIECSFVPLFCSYISHAPRKSWAIISSAILKSLTLHRHTFWTYRMINKHTGGETGKQTSS